MSSSLEPRRPYRSRRRKEQAEETRTRIQDAAQRLLVERGFAGATIAAIAREAGTAQETVYQAFGSKRELLAGLVRRAVRGDDAGSVLTQAGPRAVQESQDPAEQLRLFAADVGQRLARVAPLMRVLGEAARADPELATLHRHLHELRRQNLGAVIDALAANTKLRVDDGQATESLWALASPELHGLLTDTARWSQERYLIWLAETLAVVLLAPTSVD